jgi:hypothetical protein
MSQTLFEKLQLQDEKNLLIQGLPSTIEKQFSKLSFSKNVTPLLRSRKIDFALVFALNSKHLNKILEDVCPAMNPEGKLWIAYPRASSKITSDLNRDCSWTVLIEMGFETSDVVDLDYVWSTQLFTKSDVCACNEPATSATLDKLKSVALRKLAEAESF